MAGGRSASLPNREQLIERLKSCQTKYSTVDDIVDYLRSSFSDYQGIRKGPFARVVQQALDSLSASQSKPDKNGHSSSCGVTRTKRQAEDNDGEIAVRRTRSKKVDAGEQRTGSMEEVQLRRLQQSDQNGASLASSAASIYDVDEGAVSTPEDAIYEEEVEPVVDLTKMSDSEDLPKYKGKRASRIELGEEPIFKEIGGMKPVPKELMMKVIIPFYHSQFEGKKLHLPPVSGILLHGPPGCGKTKLAQAIAIETGFPFYQTSATELISGIHGRSEENIRELFSKAYKTAPSIIFIDEIDAIASKIENGGEWHKKIAIQLITCMDESHRLVRAFDGSSNPASSGQKHGSVLVIGATNRPDAIDPALRRPGRFDREIALGVPDENARAEILSGLTRSFRLEGDLEKLARSTPGFVGADLVALVNEARNLAIERLMVERMPKDVADDQHTNDWWKQPLSPEEIDKLSVTMADFKEAVKIVQPSSKREGFPEIPNVKWVDVGGLDDLREEFNLYIVGRVKYPEIYEELGLDLDAGFLLYGPPGCGKTLIAKAVANEAGANFIYIKGPELLNKYVGESERAVRTLFSRARTCSPCILFFDEVDALTAKGRQGWVWAGDLVLKQLLTELDGADKRRDVFVIGATNRPEMMDGAVLRPGRFGKHVYVPLPSADQRESILKALARKKNVDESVDLAAIARMEGCENFSGADLAALMNEAAMAIVKEKLKSKGRSSGRATIKTTHFERALSKIRPSVSEEQRRFYEELSKTF